MEKKEIPKNENQGLNGTGVSLAALVFLLIAVPIAATYLIDVAIYFGGDEVKLSTGEVTNQEAPIWTNTGSSNVSMCTGNDIDTLDLCGATYNRNSPIPTYYKGDMFHELPGCENYTQQPIPSGAGGFCGSDSYDLFVNMTNFMIQNRTFPEIEINFVSSDEYLCNSSNFGDSKVDYKLQWRRYTPLYQGSALYFINSSVTFEGISEFDSGGPFEYEPTDMCAAWIQIKHFLTFSQLDSLEDLRKEFFDSNNDIIYLTIELDNLRTASETPYDYTNFYTPFQGATLEHNYFNVKTPTYEVDALNFVLRIGVFTLGLGFWIIALASTPLWNPTKARYFS
jgi:hypothetical protein